jgi:hypothetical protein
MSGKHVSREEQNQFTISRDWSPNITTCFFRNQLLETISKNPFKKTTMDPNMSYVTSIDIYETYLHMFMFG